MDKNIYEIKLLFCKYIIIQKFGNLFIIIIYLLQSKHKIYVNNNEILNK